MESRGRVQHPWAILLDGVELERMDLLGPMSIDTFAERFLASRRPIHLVVNSAGIIAGPLVRNARGYESQFATNHLGQPPRVLGGSRC